MLSDLPHLCLDLVVQALIVRDDKWRRRCDVARDAACLALCGNDVTTSLSRALYDSIDPGYEVRYHDETTRLSIAARRLLSGRLHSIVHETDFGRWKACDLRSVCREVGQPTSGTKAVLVDRVCHVWRHAQAALKPSRAGVSDYVRSSVRIERDQCVGFSEAKRLYGLWDTDRTRIPMGKWGLYRVSDVIAYAENHRGGKEGHMRTMAIRAARSEVVHVRAGRDLMRYSSGVVVVLREKYVETGDEAALMLLSDIGRRHDDLLRALIARGCTLRSDSRLCRVFIEEGNGSIDDIVNIMDEMKFFFGHTDYSERMRRGLMARHNGEQSPELPPDSDTEKSNALRAFVQRDPLAAAHNPHVPHTLLPVVCRMAVERLAQCCCKSGAVLLPDDRTLACITRPCDVDEWVSRHNTQQL